MGDMYFHYVNYSIQAKIRYVSPIFQKIEVLFICFLKI